MKIKDCQIILKIEYPLNKWFADDDVLSDNNEQSYMCHLAELYLSKNIVETVPQITTDELNIMNQMQPCKSSPNDLLPIVFQKLSTENKLFVKQFFSVCLLCLSSFPFHWKIHMLKILCKPNKKLITQLVYYQF